jgi:hypothetical protein
MFDITKKRAADTAKIDLVDADGGPLNDDAGNRLSVTLCGPGSKTWQQADAERNRRQAARAEKNPRKFASLVADHRRDDEIDFLTAITVSFNGWTYPGEYPSPRDMFKAAYNDDGIGFIRDQLSKEGNDWASFQGNGSKPSASGLVSSLG